MSGATGFHDNGGPAELGEELPELVEAEAVPGGDRFWVMGDGELENGLLRDPHQRAYNSLPVPRATLGHDGDEVTGGVHCINELTRPAMAKRRRLCSSYRAPRRRGDGGRATEPRCLVQEMRVGAAGSDGCQGPNRPKLLRHHAGVVSVLGKRWDETRQVCAPATPAAGRGQRGQPVMGGAAARGKVSVAGVEEPDEARASCPVL